MTVTTDHEALQPGAGAGQGIHTVRAIPDVANLAAVLALAGLTASDIGKVVQALGPKPSLWAFMGSGVFSRVDTPQITPFVVGPTKASPYEGASGLTQAITDASAEFVSSGREQLILVLPGTYAIGSAVAWPNGVHFDCPVMQGATIDGELIASTVGTQRSINRLRVINSGAGNAVRVAGPSGTGISVWNCILNGNGGVSGLAGLEVNGSGNSADVYGALTSILAGAGNPNPALKVVSARASLTKCIISHTDFVTPAITVDGAGSNVGTFGDAVIFGPVKIGLTTTGAFFQPSNSSVVPFDPTSLEVAAGSILGLVDTTVFAFGTHIKGAGTVEYDDVGYFAMDGGPRAMATTLTRIPVFKSNAVPLDERMFTETGVGPTFTLTDKNINNWHLKTTGIAGGSTVELYDTPTHGWLMTIKAPPDASTNNLTVDGNGKDIEVAATTTDVLSANGQIQTYMFDEDEDMWFKWG